MVASGIKLGLTDAGYAVDWVGSAERAIEVTRSEAFDVAIIDIGLPTMDGLALTQRLRKDGHAMPVLILTARDATADKIAGLDSGADDYLVKPVDIDELAARLRALARRTTGRAAALLRHGEVTLDPAGRRVTVADFPVELSAREFAVLHALLANAGRVMTRGQLESSIYGWRDEPDSNALEVHIHHLRKKLGADFIKTLRGVGYTIPQ